MENSDPKKIVGAMSEWREGRRGEKRDEERKKKKYKKTKTKKATPPSLSSLFVLPAPKKEPNMSYAEKTYQFETRGIYILLEGADRLGKTTQAKMLGESMRTAGIPCHNMAFPDRKTDIGKIIDRHLKKEECYLDAMGLQLLFAANKREKKEEINLNLVAGTSVVCDRGLLSAVCYSTADGCDEEWAQAINIGLLVPDITIILTADIEVIQSRMIKSESNELYDHTDFQLKIMRKFEQFKYMLPNVNIVNADDTPENVHREILRVIKANFPNWTTDDRLEHIC